MDARYTVRVRRNFNSELRTAGGAIIGSELTGTMSADTSGGKLKFTHLKGPTGATTSGGSIELNGCEGAVKVDTSGGRIESIDGSGTLEARTSGGATWCGISAATPRWRQWRPARLREYQRQNIRADLGRIDYRAFAIARPGGCESRNIGGQHRSAVPPDAGLNVEAETNSGQVTSELPFVGIRTDRDSMKGQINGGGKSLLLRSGAGSISIKPAGSEVAAK